MPSHAPIGVFDSGVGGLSVLREIRRLLPAEDLVYVADSAAAPYGEKTREFITDRSRTMTRFLADRGAKAVVVACNTATVVAVQALRAEFRLPIIAIEPAVKPAAEQTTVGVIGVLATSQTLASESVSRLMRQHGGAVRVVLRAAPGLVEQVERGEIDEPATRSLVERYVRPLVAEGVDTIVLGCTHYPFLTRVIQEAAGPAVTVIDPAVAVARELARRLTAGDLKADSSRGGVDEFWTSGDPDQVGRVMALLWGRAVKVQQVPGARVSSELNRTAL